MTQKEKAKRYDEALKEAKDCHIDGLALSQPVKDVLEHIFPELKESDDEKIIKEIAAFFRKAAGGYLDTLTPCKTYSKWLAWLKKQGKKNDK